MPFFNFFNRQKQNTNDQNSETNDIKEQNRSINKDLGRRNMSEKNIESTLETKNQTNAKGNLEPNSQKQVIELTSPNSEDTIVFQNIELNELKRTKNTRLMRKKSHSIDKVEFIRGRSE